MNALTALPKLKATSWQTLTDQARHDYLNTLTPPSNPALIVVDLAKVIQTLNRLLPEEAIITNKAGNYAAWLHRFYQYKHIRTELAPTNGAMGYGLPAAIAAKLHHPQKAVVCIAGDGCFMMYPQELMTASQYQIPVIILVINNGMYGTIRMHQEREYPGRVSATSFQNPDFVNLAQSMECFAERVKRTEDFTEVFDKAQASNKPALIELMVDPQQLTPTLRLN